MKNKGKQFAPSAGQTRPRRLLLCLDGVPHEVMLAAKGRGLFDGFGVPSRLLSPFPTMTNIALSCMLDASVPLGYESLYFDCNARELRGGMRKYIGFRTPDKIPSSYMDKLDYQEPLAFEFLVYVAPESVWRADMKRFRERFRNAPPNRDFFAFLKGTDGLLHIRGRQHLEVALESLDRILKEINDWFGRETEIVLFSDHGMNLQENRRVHIQTHLARNGFTLAHNFAKNTPRSVAIPAFGLCGYAALYCGADEDAALLADSLVSLEGVDFAIHRDEDHGVLVRGTRGVARIARKQNGDETLYRYDQVTGDPLQLAPIASGLSQQGLLDEDGSAPDGVWYKRTADHLYPDALANLYETIYGQRVGHTADVLVSLHDGYYYGDSIFSRLARLQATHGNALRSSTNAFLMSTHREFPTFVRAHDARPHLLG
jgi:hypothetical protein